MLNKWLCIGLRSALSGLSPQNFILKKILIFFPKKTALEQFLIFSQKTPPYFAGNETFLYFLKNSFSYISRKVYSEP